jgi:F-box-like
MSSPIFTLPPELLQHIIVVVAAPSTIAALTQTCKFFYSLVYNPTDHHLWRQIFLTVFDDPRPVLEHLTTLRGEQPPFVWEEEFKSRMRAAQVVHRSNHPPASSSSDVDMQSTLRTLLSILETSLPFAWTTTVAFGPLPTPTPSIPPKYPTFPPLILLSSSFCNDSNKAQFSCVFESSSSLWLEELLRDGFPRVLTRRLLASPDLLGGDDITTGGGGDSSEVSVEQEWKEWTESEEARLFYKLVVHTGFIPVPTQEAPPRTNALDDPASDDGNTYFTPSPTSSGSIDDLSPPTPPLPSSEIPPRVGDPSTDAQFASARRMARRTVYDLRFLKPERMFGPFLPSSSSLLPLDGLQKKTRVDGDGDDGDYVYPGIDSDGDNTESLTDDEEDISLINLISPPNPSPPSPSHTPTPHTLKPDWSWLAAARITVEANLRDMLKLTSAIDASTTTSTSITTSSSTAAAGAGGDTSLDVGNALRRLEGVRMGGAPGFWDGWGVGGGADGGGEGEGGVGVDGKGKSKAVAEEVVEEGMYEERSDGWDWAGVAGIWK